MTGSRAEWGLLSGLARKITDDPELELQIIATNMHLSPEFGLTYREIERQGFRINRKVEMLLSSDSANATGKSVGLATIGFADAYEELAPDMLLVLGDRYEILAAVTAALFYKIPVAHLHGGEVTEGAYDDAIRHAITKMSHLHFTSTEEYRRRVIQLGEQPERVFHVGAIGIDNIRHIALLDKKVLEEQLDFPFDRKTVLVTYHPETLDAIPVEEQFRNLLEALDDRQDIRILFTLPNSDTGGRIIVRMIEEFVARNKQRARAYTSLGQLRYLSALRFVAAVVGNSSSGILEVPSFGKPTLDIGNRQKGRLAANSVVHCGVSGAEISEGLNRVLSDAFAKQTACVQNPYEKEDSALEILKILKIYPLDGIVQKTFYDIRHV